MNERRNFTVSVPADVLRKAKILAARRGTSVSSLLTQALTDLVEQHDEYEAAMRRVLARARRGFDLGTRGEISWTRESVHERRA